MKLRLAFLIVLLVACILQAKSQYHPGQHRHLSISIQGKKSDFYHRISIEVEEWGSYEAEMLHGGTLIGRASGQISVHDFEFLIGSAKVSQRDGLHRSIEVPYAVSESWGNNWDIKVRLDLASFCQEVRRDLFFDLGFN